MNLNKKILGRVFVVDDEEASVNLLTHLLKQDFVVASATSPFEAKNKLKEFNPDVLISDITMPGMTGYELVKWVREQKEFKNIKVLFLSGLGGISDRMMAYDSGGEDYIQKPYRTMELMAKVRVYIKLKKTEDELLELNKHLEEQVRLRSDQLLSSEKMAVIGRSTAGIVHNLNNPICAIAGIASLLKMKYPKEEMVDVLQGSTKKLQDIVSSLLHTARTRNSHDKKDIAINTVLSNEIKLQETNTFAKYVQFETKFNDLPTIKGIESDFSQIFGNLIDNALQSMIKSENKQLAIETSLKDNEIQITIKDTGCGIEPDNLNKIFDPFFTTKPMVSVKGEPTGTGLGMPTCKTMLEAYNGRILVDSQLNVGTTVRVLIPVS